MAEEPKPEQILNIEGPPSESRFTRPLAWLFPLDRMPEFQKELDAYWAHYKDLTDERAVVLAGSLCVEDCLDRMINAFLPASEVLRKNRYLPFSLKIDLVRACKLIPSRVLEHCNLISKLRNNFAHSLELKSLSDWGDKQFKAVDQAIKSYQPSYDLSVPHRKRFEVLVGFVCVALKVYTTHVQSMRPFIDTEDFMKSLKRFKEKEI